MDSVGQDSCGDATGHCWLLYSARIASYAAAPAPNHNVCHRIEWSTVSLAEWLRRPPAKRVCSHA